MTDKHSTVSPTRFEQARSLSLSHLGHLTVPVSHGCGELLQKNMGGKKEKKKEEGKKGEVRGRKGKREKRKKREEREKFSSRASS